MVGGILRVLKRVAEVVTVVMSVVIFFSVLYQVYTRYVLGVPANWTLELASILWLWLIFWAGSLLIPDDEQIRIEFVYELCPGWLQKALTVVSAVLIIGGMSVAFLPTLDFVQFMRIDYSPILRIGYDKLFSVFLLFMVCAILRACFVLYRLARPRNTDLANGTTAQ